MQASSAISFRLPPASFSADAWPGSPLLSSFRFLASLGFHFHGRLPFPLLFLTPAVFAPFRSLQFWVLTTQPLFFLSALFTLLPHSCFCAAPSVLSSLRFFPFLPGWFPIRSLRFCLLGLAVCFLSPFLASLPQPFRKCLPRSRSLSLPFLWHLSVPPRFLSSASGFPSQLLSFLALPFRFFPHSPCAGSFGAPSFLSSRRSPLPSAPVSRGFCPIPLTRFSASFSFVLPGSSPAADFPVLALLSASSRPLLP